MKWVWHPNHSDAKGKVEEKVQGSNCAITEGSDARVQYGAMWRGNHDKCRQHFSVNVKMSNTWWVWNNFENVVCSEESSALAWDAMWNTLNFWWFPVSDLHHEIILNFQLFVFHFVLLQQFSQKFHWQVATMAEGAGWSESAPRDQDSAQQSKTAKTTQSDAEFQTGLLGCNKVTKNLRHTKHGKCARASTKGPNLILITTHIMLSMPCSVCLCLTDLLVVDTQ